MVHGAEEAPGCPRPGQPPNPGAVLAIGQHLLHQPGRHALHLVAQDVVDLAGLFGALAVGPRGQQRHVGHYDTRAERAHDHFAAAYFLGQRTRHVADGAFGRSVRRKAGRGHAVAAEALEHVHRAAAVLLAHALNGHAAAVERAQQVGVDYFSHLVGRKLAHIDAAIADSGVVDPDIDRAEAFHSGVPEKLHAGVVAHVAAFSQDLAVFGQVGCGRGGALVAAPAQDHAMAALEEFVHQPAADTPRAAGYHYCS